MSHIAPLRSLLVPLHPKELHDLTFIALHRYDVLPYAIGVLQAKGYSLVTVAECLGQSAYQWVGSPQTPTVRLRPTPTSFVL